ncbi:MAG: VWA domain-containing protein [Planctomycetales bacterium]|nr:VWA domain-containing protein [Planctomycetales bacterium]
MIGAFTIAALEFGSAAMLGWLAAAALPWFINLWSRNRYEETPWAAIELLLEALRHESRRLRLHNWLLLAIRTALLALVALAVARPLWRSTGAATPASAVHRIVVLDCSQSMAARQGESTRFEQAREAARELIAASTSGDAYTVLAWGAEAANVLGRPVQDANQALAAIETIDQQATRAELAPALAAIDAAVSRAAEQFPHLGSTEVVWLTDRTETTWSAALPSATAASATSVERRWRNLAEHATVTFPLDEKQLAANLAVVDMQLDPPLVPVGAGVAMEASVASFGGDRSITTPVEMLADGVVIGRQECEIPAGGVGLVRFALPALTRGEHRWEVRLAAAEERDDPLPADDVRRMVVTAQPRVRVACVADAPSAAAEIARALNPRGVADAAAPSVVRVSTTNLAATPLSDFAAVALCNVARLSDREGQQLRRYVADGGALLIVLGDRVDAAVYNRVLGPQGDDSASLLPYAVGPVVEGGPWKIDPLGYAHRILQPFAGRERSGLLTVAINKYVKLQPWPGDAAPTGTVQNAATASSGDPLVALRDFGWGRTAVLAVNPALRGDGSGDSAPWSNLAISPSFVPLMQRLIESLIVRSQVELHNRLAGQPLLLPTRAAAGGLAWQTPGGVSVSQPPARQREGTPDTASVSTTSAGFYRLFAIDDRQTAPSEPIAIYAVNPDPRESNLAVCDKRLLESTGAATSETDDGATASVSATLHSLATMLLLAALGLLLAERLVVDRLAGGRA